MFEAACAVEARAGRKATRPQALSVASCRPAPRTVAEHEHAATVIEYARRRTQYRVRRTAELQGMGQDQCVDAACRQRQVLRIDDRRRIAADRGTEHGAVQRLAPSSKALPPSQLPTCHT